jgi:hypothetical protein
MPATRETIRVEGLRELHRAFRLAEGKLDRELRGELREAAEPVRRDAERLAVAGIPRLGLPWSRMRVGVTQTAVYVAPKQKGRNRAHRRPNLADLLLGRSMIPALERNEDQIVREVDQLLGRVERAWDNA